MRLWPFIFIVLTVKIWQRCAKFKMLEKEEKKVFFSLIRSSVVRLKFNLFKCVSHAVCQKKQRFCNELKWIALRIYSNQTDYHGFHWKKTFFWNEIPLKDRNEKKKVAHCSWVHSEILSNHRSECTEASCSICLRHDNTLFVVNMIHLYSTIVLTSLQCTTTVCDYESFACLLPKFIECASHGKWVRKCHIKKSIKLKGIHSLSRRFQLFFFLFSRILFPIA